VRVFLLEKVLLFFIVVASIARALSSGKDVNWDLQNYHHYAPWALIHGRYTQDVLAGNWQSYLNPTIYLIRYASLSFGTWWSAIILSSLQSIALILTYKISSNIFRKEPIKTRFQLASSATFLAMLSPIFASELGTSFVDGLLCVPMVAALLLLNVDSRGDRTWIMLSVSGVMMGFAVGFKVTNALFLPGYALAALLGQTSGAAIVRTALATAVGGIVGLIVSAGPWAYVMWRDFGNPFFPLAGFINPREALLVNTYDTNFLPDGIIGALILPLKWALGIQSTAEMAFTDIRPVIQLSILFAFSAKILFLKRRKLHIDDLNKWQITVFLALGTVMWISTSSIHRYAAILELLLGPSIIIGVYFLFNVKRALLVGAGLIILAVLTIDVPNWRHVRPFGQSYFVNSLPYNLPENPTFILLPQRELPLGFLAAEFPLGSVFIQSGVGDFFSSDSVLYRRAHEIIYNTPVNNLLLLTDGNLQDNNNILVAGVIMRREVPCQEILTVVRSVWICPLIVDKR
jgi:hypothetical protein